MRIVNKSEHDQAIVVEWHPHAQLHVAAHVKDYSKQQGCDASNLLDNTATFNASEKNADPNRNSARGYEVIDEIKSMIEAKCPAIVSCSNILALAARGNVVLLGGSTWEVGLGRLDSKTASPSEANSDLAPPSSNLSTLVSKFAAKGFDAREMTALSGAHTIGLAHCASFRTCVHNKSNIDPAFAQQFKTTFPITGSSSLSPLDKTSKSFDNEYYKDLIGKKGLPHSDQEFYTVVNILKLEK